MGPLRFSDPSGRPVVSSCSQRAFTLIERDCRGGHPACPYVEMRIFRTFHGGASRWNRRRVVSEKTCVVTKMYAMQAFTTFLYMPDR
jgi:hypothetical protein